MQKHVTGNCKQKKILSYFPSVLCFTSVVKEIIFMSCAVCNTHCVVCAMETAIKVSFRLYIEHIKSLFSNYTIRLNYDRNSQSWKFKWGKRAKLKWNETEIALKHKTFLIFLTLHIGFVLQLRNAINFHFLFSCWMQIDVK